MCGIGGIINYKRNSVSLETVGEIGESIKHRGPNDHGFFFYNGEEKILTRNLKEGFAFNISLIHRRLSILDLSERGWQPMQTANGRFTISFNGEVYNYIELRKTLIKKGHTFHTETDTEVVLYAYQEWGINSLSLFNGMFAFAIHDALKNEICIARDPFGIKPLYYVHNERFFLFCSEIKGILKEPTFSKSLDGSILYDYLTYGKVNHSSDTLFREIKELPSAHYSIVSGNCYDSITLKQYWKLQENERRDLTFEDAVDQVKELFYNNIKIHLRSDVEVGYTLSGGIDSSSIIGVSNDLMPEYNKYAFSYIPNYIEKSEKKWIDIVNKKVNSLPYTTEPSEATFITEIENIIKLQDEPFTSTSIYAQYKVFELISQNNIKVVLDGQGADEIFAGYPIYFFDRSLSILKRQGIIQYLRFLNNIHPTLKVSKQKYILKTISHFLPKDLQRSLHKKFFSHSSRLLKKDFKREVENNIRDSLYMNSPLKNSLHKSLKFEGLPFMLRYQDRNSMAFSIEGRVPFLTKDLVEFVYSLPESYILNNDGYTKKLLRSAVKDVIPIEIMERKDKIGFETPEKQWIRNSSAWTFGVIDFHRGKSSAINLKRLEKEFKEIFDDNLSYTDAHWRYLNFLKWLEINKLNF